MTAEEKAEARKIEPLSEEEQNRILLFSEGLCTLQERGWSYPGVGSQYTHSKLEWPVPYPTAIGWQMVWDAHALASELSRLRAEQARVRDEALEEAAEECERSMGLYGLDHDGEFYDSVVSDIRSLKSQSKGDTNAS